MAENHDKFYRSILRTSFGFAPWGCLSRPRIRTIARPHARLSRIHPTVSRRSVGRARTTLSQERRMANGSGSIASFVFALMLAALPATAQTDFPKRHIHV